MFFLTDWKIFIDSVVKTVAEHAIIRIFNDWLVNNLGVYHRALMSEHETPYSGFWNESICKEVIS